MYDELIGRLKRIKVDYDLARGIHLTVSDAAAAITDLQAQLAQERAKVRYQRAQGSTRAELRESLTRAMIDTGDCILVWANEGDLYERGDHVS